MRMGLGSLRRWIRCVFVFFYDSFWWAVLMMLCVCFRFLMDILGGLLLVLSRKFSP